MNREFGLTMHFEERKMINVKLMMIGFVMLSAVGCTVAELKTIDTAISSTALILCQDRFPTDVKRQKTCIDLVAAGNTIGDAIVMMKAK